MTIQDLKFLRKLHPVVLCINFCLVIYVNTVIFEGGLHIIESGIGGAALIKTNKLPLVLLALISVMSAAPVEEMHVFMWEATQTLDLALRGHSLFSILDLTVDLINWSAVTCVQHLERIEHW